MAKTNKKTSTIYTERKSIPIWQHRLFLEWLVFLFSFFLFFNSVFNNYNLDDELVTNNHQLTSKGISAIPDIFTSPYYQDQSGYAYEYRPIVLVSFAIEHQFFGDNPHVSHFFNILLYALTCLVLYKVLLVLLKKYSPVLSLAIALLFAAHPAHTEVVCSIKNRDEILALLFGLLSLWAAIKAKKNIFTWIQIAFFFTLALMSKVTVISFILIIPLAAILVENTNFLWLIGISVATLIPAYFLINITDGYEKVKILSAVILVIITVYIFANYKPIFQYVKKVINHISTILFDRQTIQENEITNGYFQNFITRIIPDRNLVVLPPIIITMALAVTYSFGIIANYSIYAVLPITLLLILAWIGEEKISWWACVMIGICLTVGIYKAHIDFEGSLTEELYYHLLCLYLSYQAFYGKRGLFIPSMLCFFIVNCHTISVANRWDGVFSLPIIFLAFKYSRLVLVLLLIANNIHLIYTAKERVPNIAEFIVTVLVILSVHYDKRKNELALAIALFTFILFHFYQVQIDKQVRLDKAIYTISSISKKVNPQTTFTTQYRPLNFIEECINSDSSASVRMGTSLEVLSHYLYKVILPYPMSFYYGYKFIYPQKVTEPIPIISLIIHLLLVIIAIAWIHREPLLAFGMFIYLVSIVIFSNYFYPVPGMLADRFMLIPSLGWIIVLVVIWQKAVKIPKDTKANNWKFIPATAKYPFIFVLLLYSSITFSRNFDWKDNLTLFRHDISYVNQSAQAHNLLGVHIMKSSLSESDPVQKINLEKEALFHLKKSMEIYPYFFNTAYDVGRIYATLDMPDSAVAAYRYSLTLDTMYNDVYLSVGSILTAQSKFSEAVPYFKSLIRLGPNEYIGYERLSLVYFKMDQFDSSVAVNLKAIDRIPNIPDPYINIGRTYIVQKKLDSARVYLTKADQIAPNLPVVKQLLQQANVTMK